MELQVNDSPVDGEGKSHQEIVKLLDSDYVVIIKQSEQRVALLDFMEDAGIDPDDYRMGGYDIWRA